VLSVRIEGTVLAGPPDGDEEEGSIDFVRCGAERRELGDGAGRAVSSRGKAPEEKEMGAGHGGAIAEAG
jgi:hypothetical protein